MAYSGFKTTGVVPRKPTKEEWEDILTNQPFMQYIKYNNAIRRSVPYVADLIKQAPIIEGLYPYTFVKVKVAYLKVNQSPCSKWGWHTDIHPNPFRRTVESNDYNVLISIGEGCRTEFVCDIVKEDWDPQPEQFPGCTEHMDYLSSLIRRKIPDGEFVTYDKYGFHTCSYATSEGPRLLVRVSQTTEPLRER